MVDYSWLDKPWSEVTDAELEEWRQFFDRPLSEWTEAEKQEYEERMGQPPFHAKPVTQWTQEQRREYWERETGSPDPIPGEELDKLDEEAWYVGLDYCDEDGWLMMCCCGHRERLSGCNDLHVEEQIDLMDRPMLCSECEKKSEQGYSIELPYIHWHAPWERWMEWNEKQDAGNQLQN